MVKKVRPRSYGTVKGYSLDLKRAVWGAVVRSEVDDVDNLAYLTLLDVFPRKELR